MVSITLALSALMVRLVWEVTIITVVGSMVIVALLILVTLSLYALALYLTIKPGLKKASSLPIKIWVTVIITAGLISGIIHFIRFMPLPETDSPISAVIAILLLLAGISVYLQALVLIWSIWPAKT